MKSQKKLQERFFSCLFELRSLIEALDAYQAGSFEKIVRQLASSFVAYSRSLVTQVFEACWRDCGSSK